MRELFKTWKWTRVGEAILLFLIGLAFIIWPESILNYMGLILGIFLIVYGGLYIIFEIIKRHYRSSIVGLILGIAYLLVGIVLISIKPTLLQEIAGKIVAILILAEGLSTVAQAIYENGDNNYWILKLVVGIITTMIGIFVMVNTLESASILIIIIGAVLVYIAITQLVNLLVLSRKDKKPALKKPKSGKIIDAEVVDHRDETKK